MDAIGFLGIGIGGYMMYAAIKNQSPWGAFLKAFGLGGSSNGGTGSIPATNASVANAGAAAVSVGAGDIFQGIDPFNNDLPPQDFTSGTTTTTGQTLV